MNDNAFVRFSKLVADSFQGIVKHERAFVVDLDPDEVYQNYLKAFPEGTNPIFKKNTEHDCSCCRHFIKHVGHVVMINDNESMSTVWDKAAENAPYPYNEVAKAMKTLVNSSIIADLFAVGKKENHFGHPTTRSLDESQKVLSWNHLHTGEVPSIKRWDMPDSVKGEYRTTSQVFQRGLDELSGEAVDTVISLIDAKNLYRGEEFRKALTEFKKAQSKYKTKKTPQDKNFYVWNNAFGPASKFRNTVIGTLIVDLTDGTDIESAVGSYEAKVAPTNYKRTTALITEGMVKKAMETLHDLDLESALERRFARIEDISIRDVLWVDNGVKSLMKGGIGDMLMSHVAAKKTTSVDEGKIEEVNIEDFMKDVLPQSSSIEALFRSEHLGNLMSLTAPVHPEPKQLFRWSNDFAWSYGGNVTDSIKERVKKAGGNVTNASLRVSLSWFNHDDLDLSVDENVNGKNSHIYYGARIGAYQGQLDVDMNAGRGTTRHPVENISWAKLWDGTYKVAVKNFNQREKSDVGFVVEVECNGKLHHFHHPQEVRNQTVVDVALLTVQGGKLDIKVLDSSIRSSNVSQEKWGLGTEKFIKVNAVVLSPNYWGDNASGNKHFFFVLDGAKNDEPTRGIYNEFLHPRLEQHRKVFEVIGDKTKCQPTDGQLSGLGFSSTKRDSLILKLTKNNRQYMYNVQF